MPDIHGPMRWAAIPLAAFFLIAAASQVKPPPSDALKATGPVIGGPEKAPLKIVAASKIPASLRLDRPCAPGADIRSSDLCAQWKAADAASTAALWAMIGTIVAALGTAGLYWQISLTRKAVRDTADATVAMKEANEIARETSKRELRAYMNVDECEINNIEGGFLLSAILKNCGQTPAYNVRIEGESFAAEYPLRSNRGFVVPSEGYDAPIGPGQTIGGVYRLTTEDPTMAMDRVLSGEIGLYVQGTCSYSDVFGEKHETRFRYVFGGRVARSGGMVMHATEYGNSAT